MKATSYMYFAYSKMKVPLYNSKDYCISIGNDFSIKVDPCDEILLLEYLYYPNDMDLSKRNIHQWLSNSYKDFPYPFQEKFIEIFINDHVGSVTDSEEIPIHAIDGIYSFHVPTLGNTITITEEQEIELVNIIKSNKRNPKKQVIQWFINYYFDRGENVIAIYDSIKQISIEFISAKGVAVSQGINIDSVLMGVAIIWKILISILGAIIFIILLFSIINS